MKFAWAATLLSTAALATDVVFELVPTEKAASIEESRALLEEGSKQCTNFEVLPPREGAGIEVLGSDALAKSFVAANFEIVNVTETRPFSEINPPDGYHNPAQLISMARDLQSRFPNLAEVFDVTSSINGPRTHEGRVIYALKISDNVGVDEVEPNQFVVSAHHCRELITPELAIDIATRLLEGYASGDTADIVDNWQTYIVWDHNPDGLEYVWNVNNMWRKNRFPNSGGSYGIDLNRNYPMGWDYSCAGSTSQSSCTYRGTSPQSEAESQVNTLFQTERKFAKVIDFHSYAREVRVIYADSCRNCANLPSAMDTYVRSVGQDFAQPMNYRQVRSCCTGGNIHAAYQLRGSLAFLVETGTAFQPPANTMRQELERVWPGAKWALELPIALTGTVTSGNGTALPDATFSTSNWQYTEGEVGGTTNSQGVYHFWLPDGTWSVTCSVPGYPSQTQTVQVTYPRSTIVDWVF